MKRRLGRLPWSLELAELLLEGAWPFVDYVVNAPRPPCHRWHLADPPDPPCRRRECAKRWRRVRQRFARLVASGPAPRARPVVLPMALDVVHGHGGPRLGLTLTVPFERPQELYKLEAVDELTALVLVLLSVPELRHRLQRCAQCERFLIRPGARGRRQTRAFCSAACREEWGRRPEARRQAVERARRARAVRLRP